MSRPYLIGALHDATERDYTYRLSQKGGAYVELIASMVQNLGYNAWTYREGDSREVYVAEFSKQIAEGYTIETDDDKREYVRGYFDADGSVPKDSDARFYVYFAQNDRQELERLKEYLETLGIQTGTLHRPSSENAPEYWRFYVSSAFHETFASVIGSWHPRKRKMLREMRRSTP